MRNSFKNFPDDKGHFESFGGRYVAETLMPLILDLEKAYEESKNDPSFKSRMNSLLKDYVGRPSPLYFAKRLTSYLKGPKIYFKRDELNHTGAHHLIYSPVYLSDFLDSSKSNTDSLLEWVHNLQLAIFLLPLA